MSRAAGRCGRAPAGRPAAAPFPRSDSSKSSRTTSYSDWYSAGATSAYQSPPPGSTWRAARLPRLWPAISR